MAFILFPRLIHVWIWALRLMWAMSFQLDATPPRCMCSSPPKWTLGEALSTLHPASLTSFFTITLQTAQIGIMLMQDPAEGAFRADISEMTNFYISLKNSINYEQVLLFSNLQCSWKSLIPFQDAQQCVLSWTLRYTHYLTLQILGTPYPLKSLETEPSVGAGLSLQYINQKGNKSGHAGDNLVVQNGSTKVSQFWWIFGSTAWQSMTCLPKLCWFVRGGREANPGRRILCHGKERKAALYFYKQSVLRALNER